MFNISTGTVIAQVFTANQALPIANASVTFLTSEGEIIAHRTTNLNGKTSAVEIDTPAKALSTSPQEAGMKVFTSINIKVTHPNYNTIIFTDAQVFEGQESIQNVFLIPLPEYSGNTQPQEFFVVPQTL